MNDFLRAIETQNYAPESVENLAKQLKQKSGRVFGKGIPSSEDVHELLDTSCMVLPNSAVKCVLSLLLLDALRHEKTNLAEYVKKLLLTADSISLHYETNSENLVIAEIGLALKDLGCCLDDIAFIFESNCVSNGMAWYSLNLAYDYIKVSDIATALNLEAIRGETGAFDDRLSSLARPFQGQIDCAKNIRSLLKGSQLVTDEGRYAFGYDTHPRVQDAISVRATPQTHGGVRDIYYFAKETLLFTIENDLQYNCDVEYALDGLITALSDLANICERRAFRLNDTRLSHGLPMNLTIGDAGINHGFPVVQSNQAALLAELKLLSLPSAVVKKQGDCASYYAACKMLRALPLLAKILSIEVLMACQGMDIVKAKIPSFELGVGTGAVYSEVRKTIFVMTKNRFVSPDMNEAARLVENGDILKAAEKAVCELR